LLTFCADHFSKCNAYLEKRGLDPIDWNLEKNDITDLAVENAEEIDEKGDFEECE
jgi:hypothetical protein